MNAFLHHLRCAAIYSLNGHLPFQGWCSCRCTLKQSQGWESAKGLAVYTLESQRIQSQAKGTDLASESCAGLFQEARGLGMEGKEQSAVKAKTGAPVKKQEWVFLLPYPFHSVQAEYIGWWTHTQSGFCIFSKSI